MQRREFSKKIKLSAFERCKGFCEKCTAKLRPGQFEYDHDLSDAMGGEPTLENCVVACSACHKEKTTNQDVPLIAKSNRIRNRHQGIKKARRGRPMPGGRDSPFKIKMNGEIVRR